jgi:hypothetical protein
VRFLPSWCRTPAAKGRLARRRADGVERPLQRLSLCAAALAKEFFEARLSSLCEPAPNGLQRRVRSVSSGRRLVEPDRDLEPARGRCLDLRDPLLKIGRQCLLRRWGRGRRASLD